MLNHLLPALAGAAFGAAVPWPLKALWRVLRGDADRASQAAEAEAVREAAAAQAELQRLLDLVGRMTARIGDLEELVDLLRKALDKHLIRESAIASACELLIALAKLVPHPNGAMLHIRDRAQHLLEDARAHVVRINGGGCGQ